MNFSVAKAVHFLFTCLTKDFIFLLISVGQCHNIRSCGYILGPITMKLVIFQFHTNPKIGQKRHGGELRQFLCLLNLTVKFQNPDGLVKSKIFLF